jgi:Outer membrane protein beta-barrel domain
MLKRRSRNHLHQFRIYFIILFLFISVPVKSQVIIALLFGDKLNTEKLEFGLTVGPNFSSVSNSGADWKAGLGLGLYFNIKLSDNWFFHPEAIPKSPFGGKGIPVYPLDDPNLNTSFQNGSITREMSYISLPLLFRYRIKGLLFAEAGPQLSLRTNVKDIFKEDAAGGELEFVKNVENDYTRFDFGAAAGLVLKLKKDKGMGIGVRYYYGFIDVMKSSAGSQQNNGLFVYVSFAVGAGKSKSEK